MKKDKQLEQEIKKILKEESSVKWWVLIAIIATITLVMWIAVRTGNTSYVSNEIIKGPVYDISRATSLTLVPGRFSPFR
jgi:hypothetical protein